MSRARKRWLVCAGGIMWAACTDPLAPPSPVVKLAFTMQPSSTTAGAAIAPVVAVALQDASGELVPSATNIVTVAIETIVGGSTVTGTTSVRAVRGVATFSDLHVNKAGAGYALKATATGLTSATSTQFAIAAGPATWLMFTVQPSNAMGGDTIAPPVQVTARDFYGNLATEFEDSVTIALAGNAAPGTLSGTRVVKALGGVATFSDLSIGLLNGGYRLLASAMGLSGAGSAPFAIAKPTGSLRITAATSGVVPDPDGYAACIDPPPDGQGGFSCGNGVSDVAANGAVSVIADTGAHTVMLTGVAAHCALAGDNPRAVHAARGQTAVVTFDIACRAMTLHITTTTTGVSVDPDGYSLCIDPYPSHWDFGDVCTTSQAIGLNNQVTMSVVPGTVVQLDGVAANCTVDLGTVEAADTTEMAFTVTCAAAGAVRVTAVSHGVDVPDASGAYVVCVDSPCSNVGWVRPNDSATFPNVLAGPRTVTLHVDANCTVSGGTTRSVTVPQDGTVDVAFDVVCVEVDRIAYSQDGTISVIRLDTWEPLRITAGLAPAWSPNGTRLAYECGGDICAINADGTGFAQLTVAAAGNRHPTWSPDGSKIAFAATRAGVANIYVMAANGSGVAQLTQAVGFLGNPAWSPDGTRIVFDCRVDAGNDDLCSVSADGSGLTRLTSDPARDYGAAWRPDGQALAFATSRYGVDEIALVGGNGGSVTRVGAGLPGVHPSWSPDGTQLAFVQPVQACGGGWDYDCDWYYWSEEIVTANVDGSGVRNYIDAHEPAWKPRQ